VNEDLLTRELADLETDLGPVLRQRLRAVAATVDAPDRPVRRPARRRWVLTSLAAAAAVVTAVVVVPVVTAPGASAEQVLLVTAEAAGQQPDLAVGAEYWHVRSEVEYPGTTPFVREIWHGRTAESVLVDAAATRGRVEALGGPATYGVGGHLLTWADLDALPTDPDELADLLRAQVAGHESGEENALWEAITGLLLESPASPALRQALWEVAARMPDVELLGPATDATGRTGTAIERDQTDAGWYRVVYVLDPTTGVLLERRDVDEDGTIAFRSTQLSADPSADAPVAQPPICGPGSVPEVSC
jgi:hypothetical protein